MSLQEFHFEVPKAEVVAIEYPGFLRDTNKALTTLGGLDSIASAVSTKHYLKLKLRPDDRTSHPLYGERFEQTRLLLRIARPRQPLPGQASLATGASSLDGREHMETDSSAEGDTASVSVSVIARVTPTFRFAGLADYAFIPHDPLLPSRTRDLLPYDQRPDRAEPTKAMQPFLLVPQLFSWLDLPQDYAFKQVQTRHHPRGLARSEPNWGDAPVISFYAEGVPPPASTGAVAVAAAEAAAAAVTKPAATTAPGAAAAPVANDTPQADIDVADVRAYRVLETEVSRLLAQRPVWGLGLMWERCAACPAVQAAMPGGCNAAAVERVVQRLCYRFKTGPWRGLFIRRGYDPRADVGARKYQAVVYSLPHNWYRNLLKTGSLADTEKATATAASEQDAAQWSAAAADGGADAEGIGAAANGCSPNASAIAAPAAAGGGGGGDGAGGDVPPAGPGPAWSALAPSCLDDLHNFRALPTTQNVTFQLVDLQLQDVQQVLQEPCPNVDAIRCSEKTGWFANATMQRMQNAVQQRFLQLMDRLAPPGMSSGSTESRGGGGRGGAGGGGGAGGRGGKVAMASPAGRGGLLGSCDAPAGHEPSASRSAGGDGDVAMRDSDAAMVEEPAAAAKRLSGSAAMATATGGRGGGGGGVSAAASADEALRALMAQMNLQSLAAPGSGNGSVAVAGLFGSDDEDDYFQLLDEQDGTGGMGDEDEDGVGTPPAQGRSNGRGGGSGCAAIAAGASSRGDGDGDDNGKRDEEEGLGEGSDADDSAIESEYDIGIGDEDDDDNDDEENDEEDGEEEGLLSAGLGRMAGGVYGDGTYGRVTVPYDGGGVPDRRFDSGGMTGGMFGSEDDDEPY